MLKSRKRMLLSSIAMLLVALIALGSATFAWYITNASVDAETSQFSAASADGLVIRHTTNDDWANKITDLETKSSLTPATFNYPATYANLVGATGSGTTFSDGTLNGNLTEQTVALNSYFLVDSFYVASSSGSSVEANMSVTASTVAGTYMNIAIYVGGTLQAVLSSDTATAADDASPRTYTSKVTSSTGVTPVTYSAADATNGVLLTKMNNNSIPNVDASKDTFTCTSKDAGDGLKVDIVAFADGFNSKCANATANTTNVTVKYNFTTA